MLKDIANLIWTVGMNLPDIALIPEDDIYINFLEQKHLVDKEEHGLETSTNPNFINL